MAAAVVVPPLEFTASDLVKCTVTVNSTPLYGIIRGVLEALHGVKQHLESMDSKLEGMDERITANRVELEAKIDGVASETQSAIEGLREEFSKNLASMKEERQEQDLKLEKQMKRLQIESNQNRDFIEKEKSDRIAQVRKLESDVGEQISATNSALTDAIKELDQRHGKRLDEQKSTLSNVKEELTTRGEEIDAVYSLFEFHKPRVLALTDTPSNAKIDFLHTAPVFNTIMDIVKKDRSRTDTKFDSLHRRIGATEQVLSKKADQSEVDELRAHVDTHEIEENIKNHHAQIQKLFTITDLTDKTLQVEMEKKAEKDRVEVLAHDVQLLESRLREALESVGNNRWQQLMDKVGDLDHYLQKMDRRKVGRNEFQRMAKQLRQQVVGDVAYDGSRDLPGFTATGGFSNPSDPMSMSLTMASVPGGAMGTTQASLGTDGLRSPARSLPGLDHSRGSGGGGYGMDGMGPDAAFIRYRCLSCNKPASKLVDEGMRKAPHAFPPSGVLTSNPNSIASVSVRMGESITTLSTAAARQDKKLENYFQWVEGQAMQYPASDEDAGSADHLTPQRVRSPSPHGEPPASLADRKAKKVRTSLVGSDNKLYAGLQSVNRSVMQDHEATVQQLSKAADER